MARPACRIGVDIDLVHDCQTPVRAQASDDVFVNGIGWSLMTHLNTPHIYGADCDKVHSAPISVGSDEVFVNGLGSGRITDNVLGCTIVVTGSDDVYAGPN